MNPEKVQLLEAFLDELSSRAKEDVMHLELAMDVYRRLVPYHEAVKYLTPEQTEAIEDYIAACEDLEYSLVFLAYAIGREHQRMGIADFTPGQSNTY